MRILLVSCALAVCACARGAAPAPADGGSAPSSAPAAAADTLRGTVRIVGSEPLTSVVLEPGGGGAVVTLEGERKVLERLSGIEVAVEGEPEAPGRFRVARVHVRAADGVAAVDGVLARDGGRDVLVLGDGRRVAVARLPEPLRGKAGARVWISGRLDGDVDAWGVIAEAP